MNLYKLFISYHFQDFTHPLDSSLHKGALMLKSGSLAITLHNATSGEEIEIGGPALFSGGGGGYSAPEGEWTFVGFSVDVDHARGVLVLDDKVAHFDLDPGVVLFDSGGSETEYFRPLVGAARQFAGGAAPGTGSAAWYSGAASCVQFFGAALTEAQVKF